jgi:hypothetical protein
MLMGKEFIEMLHRMNIRVYNLSTGVQIIGQLIEAHESAIELKNVLELLRINIDGDTAIVMVSYIPAGVLETLIVYRSSIVTESSASLILKKGYCDSLLLNKLGTLIDPDQDQDNLVADEEDQDFDWNEIKDQYPNRNWNN